jgi:hypothetical protein
MNPLEPQELLRLRRYLSIKHHIKGRLRLAFAPEIVRWVPGAQLGRLQEFLGGIAGVLEVRLNLAARSAVLGYDPVRIPPELLSALIEGSETEAAEALQRLVFNHSLDR